MYPQLVSAPCVRDELNSGLLAYAKHLKVGLAGLAFLPVNLTFWPEFEGFFTRYARSE